MAGAKCKGTKVGTRLAARGAAGGLVWRAPSGSRWEEGLEWEQVGGGAGKEAGGREHRGHLSSKRGGEM